MSWCLAVDIGGTKAEVGAVDRAGVISERVRVSTSQPTALSGKELFSRVAAAAQSVLAAVGSAPEVVGVGCGGPMERGGVTVSPLNIPVWRRFPLRQQLSDLVNTTVFVDNDAKALALAEGWLGAAVGHRNFMAMVVSTGVGGGIVLDGRLLDGESGNAGHIGHVVVNPGGRTHAGIQGTVEGEASGTALAALLGADPATADVAMRRRTGTLVGRAIGSVANLLDLGLVAVGGSVALGFGDDFFGAAQDEVDRVAVLDHSLGTRVVRAGLGADAPLVGAAAVGWRGLGHTLGVVEPT